MFYVTEHCLRCKIEIDEISFNKKVFLFFTFFFFTEQALLYENCNLDGIKLSGTHKKKHLKLHIELYMEYFHLVNKQPASL